MYLKTKREASKEKLEKAIKELQSSSSSPQSLMNLNSYSLSPGSKMQEMSMAVPHKVPTGAKLESKQQSKQHIVYTEEQVETVTDSSNIDWDDKSRLEEMVNKQNFLEELKSFDPKAYFGGMTVEDLDHIERDPRLSDMFKTF